MVPPPVLEFMMTRDTVPRAYKQEGAYYTLTGEWRRRVRPQHLDVDAKIADMDRAGIRTAALSINDPGPECFGDRRPQGGQAGARFHSETPSNRTRAVSSDWQRSRSITWRRRSRSWTAVSTSSAFAASYSTRTWRAAFPTKTSSGPCSSAPRRWASPSCCTRPIR